MTATLRHTAFTLLAACVVLVPATAYAQQTTRVSVATNGTQGNASAFTNSISANGRFVAFDSAASNLVPGDTNGELDVFVHDRLTNETTRVSVNSQGIEGNGESLRSAISADGRFVAFLSEATNLVPNDTNADPVFDDDFEAFVHDRLTGQTVRVNVDSFGNQGNAGESGGGTVRPSISADGRFVAFASFSSNLVPGDGNNHTDVFVHDLLTGVTTRVSVDSNGGEGNHASDVATISPDGRFVAFRSAASNLVPGDANNFCDFNGDGMFIDNCSDTFVHDRQTGQTTLVSVTSGGVQANGGSNPASHTALSGDGRFVVFASEASNLVTGDTNNSVDAFIHDRQTGTTTRVSVDSAGNQGITNQVAGGESAISVDGRYVAFKSAAPLVTGDTGNDDDDIYLRDLLTGQTRLVSVDSAGNEGNGGSFDPTISADGRLVAFRSAADNLVPDDTNNSQDTFVRDTAITLGIDIRPGGSPNVINLKSNGVIPVAILTTPEFNATSVNVATVGFGPAGAADEDGIGQLVDVDKDGDIDVLLHFRTQETGITCGQTSAVLTGLMTGNVPVLGSDSISVLCP